MNKYPSKTVEVEVPSNRTVPNRKTCEATGKVCYSSKHEARMSLMGQLASKSIRVYQCTEDHGHWHLTKDWAHKRRTSK